MHTHLMLFLAMLIIHKKEKAGLFDETGYNVEIFIFFIALDGYRVYLHKVKDFHAPCQGNTCRYLR